MKCRVSFLLKTYLWTVMVFIIAKVVFMLCCQEEHALSAGDMWQVIVHGLTLDLSTALYFLILPFLLVLASIWHVGKWIGIVLRVYFAIIALTFALAFVADISLYPFWHFKLDASCIQYLETPTEAMASVSWAFIAMRFVIWLLAAWLIYIVYSFSVRSLRTIDVPCIYSAFYYWYSRRIGRIDNQRRTSIFLTKPVSEPLGCESRVQFRCITGEVGQ